MVRVAVLQKRVCQHLAKRRRDVHSKARRCSHFMQILEDEDERQIDFRNRFVEPVFLQKLWMLRVTHKWQVRVQD